ncbi:MAG: UDP-N-acetylmuramate--alanine ligase [Leptospiraceae bacterium]|nr:UDP-N-acetylmuramate--alanine ligase [Leptospiraceae bacterium]MCP5493302.1 UDP-N-acetylmuramate--alanine ligase [Leptospiraceae bacterium]
MKIFFIGIGGIAMGNLAYMLKSIGHEVSGSDLNLYPPMSDKLKEWGFEPKSGFQKENVHGYDLVIVGNSISRGNPELEEVLNSGMEYMSLPQAISHFFLKKKKVIVVAGTHGKTTTTFLIYHILKEAGLSPGLFVGGIQKDGHPGFNLGEGEYFVIEGDEYDSAFFDKSSKFLHYRPYYLLLTSLDFDHADIFPNIDAIKTMFKRLLNLVPSNGKVFYWQGSENLREICHDYQLSPIEAYRINTQDSIFKIEDGSICLQNGERFYSGLMGEHNLLNTEVALRLCQTILPGETNLVRYASNFPGVKRRQEIRFQSNDTIFVEDFAHHPVAILETIKAVRFSFSGFKVISLFEPRSATSHRSVFQEEFAKCFSGSDACLITEVFNVNKVPQEMRLNVPKLIETIPQYSRTKAIYCESPQDLLEKLQNLISEYSHEKIIVLGMSNGAFGGIYPEIDEILKNRKRV